MHDPGFGPFTQPHYASDAVFFTDMPNGVQDSEYAYAAGTEIAPHVLADSRAAYSDPRLHQAPEITSYTPDAHQGGHVDVFLQTLHDLLASPSISFSVLFGECRVPASIEPIGGLCGPLRHYVVSCVAPPFPSTGCVSLSDIQIQLVMASSEKQTPATGVHIGPFTYKTPLAAAPRKRKASDGSEYDTVPRKRPFNAQLHIQERCMEPLEYDQTSPYSTVVPTPTGSGIFQNLPRMVSPRPSGHNHSTSTASQASLTAPSPHTPAYSPSFATVKTEPSPRPPMTPTGRPASAASQKSSAPKLVRTSTIQQSPPPVAANTAIQTQSFNPYAMYPLKATLKLNGDLDAVAKEWTDEQHDARRKLIEFTRSQCGSTITADWQTVAPENRQQQNITISCIWWKEKNECFVTSVDTIYLLEALVGVRFTVEEKNRIRRNLEGFRPLTVSKAKVDSEEFFKVIMGFPHPKPRNIEKDVKVFPWKILSLALKKIIGKYSASYSSTASAMTAPPSIFASSEDSADYVSYPTEHKQVSASYSGYPIVTTAGYAPNYLHSAPPSMSAPYHDLRLQVPVSGPAYNLSPNVGFQSMPMPPHSLVLTPQVMSAPPASRMPPNWEFSNYINDSPATTGPPHSASVVYPRTSIETAEFMTPTTYSMAHHR